MIAVDWGTSNFRAYHLDGDGVILARRSFPTGILKVAERQFAEVLVNHVGDWIVAGDRRVLLCGMIGSRQGWAEADYVACPVTIEDLAQRAIRVPFSGAEVLVIPGVSSQDGQGLPEVMRGEETQAMGIREGRRGASLVCLPGTHSKWLRLLDHAIVSFRTCMTGDVFAALQKSTILAHSIAPDAAHDDRAFRRGLLRSGDPGGLLHHLFSVRTLHLAGDLSQDAAASHLSGLLIGHEVRAMLLSEDPVHLVGATMLCALYAQAIVVCGGSITLEEEDAAARGLAAIGRSVRWT